MANVIVTGAAGGIGSATVAELARRRARVLAVDVDASKIPVPSDDVVPHAADVSDASAVEGMVRAATDRFGELNAIFNNAGIFGRWLPTADYPDEEFERVLAVNVRGVQLGMKHAIPALRAAGGGRIVNTASTGALAGVGSAGPYVASKHAVLGLTRCAALELHPEGITVNALCPGPTDTGMMAQILADSGGDRGEMMEPAEIAQVAAWLLLDAPHALSGVPITVADWRGGSI
jgi:NAD(P)-dependent dehydrogenase (short-subunit alcohol dehydrogenase family)